MYTVGVKAWRCDGVVAVKCRDSKALEEDVSVGREVRGPGKEEEWVGVGVGVMLGGRDVKKIYERRGVGRKEILGLAGSGGVEVMMGRED
ncbi:hypothetical protein E2C01_063012 [Portunus trituberculatus]|uniref:Uncharacterized protein n=1 Tax=Portunus trituberculatus TaxID=210409 RepID=A0A5B7HCL2_PORTR|nr:hypothetical protein [Portunus trituberculatus]